MNFARFIELASQLAAILTSGVAVWAYGQFRFERRQKRLKLEHHLKSDTGKRTVLDLITVLGMTDAEIMDAAFRSPHVKCSPGGAFMGSPFGLVLEYSDENSN
jgi:hypothetical protein